MDSVNWACWFEFGLYIFPDFLDEIIKFISLRVTD